MTIMSGSPLGLYRAEVNEFRAEAQATSQAFTEEDISHLPEPVQRYLRHCGYIDSPRHEMAEVIWEKSQIRLSPERGWMKLKTFQHNFISPPSRLAYMRAWMLVIPFEGRDRYRSGRGHMYGTLGRLIRIFDEDEAEIALGAAVVVLAEALFIPDYALQDYIGWEAVDSRTARARFIDGDVEVSGTFHFNEDGEYIRFETNDRPYKIPDGSYELVPYSIDVLSYQEQEGLRIARDVRATWHLDSGDYEYWRGSIGSIHFGTTP